MDLLNRLRDYSESQPCRFHGTFVLAGAANQRLNVNLLVDGRVCWLQTSFAAQHRRVSQQIGDRASHRMKQHPDEEEYSFGGLGET